jgi:NAD(P)-dependent dehydrogenase (short-subunit alcohol dehydrogenase family)
LQTAKEVVEKTVQELGRLDILVNNAAQQHMQSDFTQIPPEQLQSTFAINVFGYFYMAQVGAPLVAAAHGTLCDTQCMCVITTKCSGSSVITGVLTGSGCFADALPELAPQPQVNRAAHSLCIA